MRQFRCICLTCKHEKLIVFPDESCPQIGEEFSSSCSICNKETPHKRGKRVQTRKEAAELRRQEAELQLRQSIIDKCTELGFTYRFCYQSVIITTQVCDWCFDYHQPRITLYHESTVKVNFKTGNYAKSHTQFRDRKMSPLEVIDYIASHDKWRMKENQSNTSRNPT